MGDRWLWWGVRTGLTPAAEPALTIQLVCLLRKPVVCRPVYALRLVKMSRPLVEYQLALHTADIPGLNGEDGFSATIRWGAKKSAGLRFDPIHEQLVLRWRADGTP